MRYINLRFTYTCSGGAKGSPGGMPFI